MGIKEEMIPGRVYYKRFPMGNGLKVKATITPLEGGGYKYFLSYPEEIKDADDRPHLNRIFSTTDNGDYYVEYIIYKMFGFKDEFFELKPLEELINLN